jgi:hypothetical protein
LQICQNGHDACGVFLIADKGTDRLHFMARDANDKLDAGSNAVPEGLIHVGRDQ